MPEDLEPRTSENAPEEEEPRIGVYVCHCGGNISDVVNCEKVAATLARLPNVVVGRTHMFMCSDPGQSTVQEDIRKLGVNRVVIGACSPFLHEATFRRAVSQVGLNPYLYYHVGIREQDSWVHHSTPEAATEKAIRLMAAAVAKARGLEPLDPIRLSAEKHGLVVGGGVAGLRSALDMARVGLQVTLVEKSPFIGGRMARLHRIFPTDDDAHAILDGLIEKVAGHPNIKIYTRAEVTGFKGYIGNFQVTIRQDSRGFEGDVQHLDQAVAACPIEVPDEHNYGLTTRTAIIRPHESAYPPVPAIDWEHCTLCGACVKAIGGAGIQLQNQPETYELTVGAIVIATGFRPYEPRTGEFGYGEIPQVVTLPQLERLLAADGPTGGKLELLGGPVRRVAMIHCVGSRQIEGVHEPQADGQINDYCSRVCCTATLRAANEIRERFPETEVFDLYQDIRTYGRGHEEYYQRASKNRVLFLRYLGEEPPDVAKTEGDTYPVTVKVKDYLTNGEEMEVPVDMVVLAVGMMPTHIESLSKMLKVSPGTDRFLLEAHPKLRPVETSVPGIVLSGTAQGPMNIQESSAAGSAAAAKAMALLGQGTIQLDPFVAHVNPELCQGSGECVAVCPYEGAIELRTTIEKGKEVRRAVVTPANCKGCGTCVGACPHGAIDLLGWTLGQYEAMLDALVMDIPVLEEA
ncbi:MAG: CoB--CoM heterodisulfide reductase iron-sulfur subunit A family protein [Anaerolineae bacterium]|nr:CoB--CoM heterodisulfide reductase iron-sulfur subunit A family protein [Anaerolineae bacterium]